MADTHCLSLDRVAYAVGQRALIRGITLDIEAGSRTLIVGPNGAGKSVLMRLCHGLLVPSSGALHWYRPLRHAMVFQRPVMLRRSALDNILYGLSLRGIRGEAARHRARDRLDRVGLGHLAEQPARKLSGGEQQRLALARAWALEPDLLFLDEPTANLDPHATRQTELILRDIHAGGTTLMMTTHDLAQARRLATQVVLIQDGVLVESAPVETFFRNPVSEAARAFIAGELPA